MNFGQMVALVGKTVPVGDEEVIKTSIRFSLDDIQRRWNFLAQRTQNVFTVQNGATSVTRAQACPGILKPRILFLQNSDGTITEIVRHGNESRFRRTGTLASPRITTTVPAFYFLDAGALRFSGAFSAQAVYFGACVKMEMYNYNDPRIQGWKSMFEETLANLIASDIEERRYSSIDAFPPMTRWNTYGQGNPF
jgi:hypothetical protein